FHREGTRALGAAQELDPRRGVHEHIGCRFHGSRRHESRSPSQRIRRRISKRRMRRSFPTSSRRPASTISRRVRNPASLRASRTSCSSKTTLVLFIHIKCVTKVYLSSSHLFVLSTAKSEDFGALLADPVVALGL